MDQFLCDLTIIFQERLYSIYQPFQVLVSILILKDLFQILLHILLVVRGLLSRYYTGTDPRSKAVLILDGLHV
jgi:hypothetical protein